MMEKSETGIGEKTWLAVILTIFTMLIFVTKARWGLFNANHS